MKRLISTLLALVMLITLLPTLPVTAAETAVTWSGDGDWLGASTRIDNTQSYELTYDVHFSAITTAGNDTWADDSMLVIRNETADHYIKFQLQAYRNGGGNYQVAPSVQVWQGNTWSDRDFFWSADSAVPITDVSMQISYNKDTSVYAWSTKNKADGGLIASGSFAAERMTNELKSCTNCALTFYRNNNNITVSNTVLTYGGSEPEPEVSGTAVTWSGDGDWLGASTRVDNTQSYELTYDVHFSAIMTAGNDTWADDCMLVIRNETADHYIKFQLQAYRNGGGNYQVAPSVQVWQGNTWSDRDFFWSADSAAPITDVSMQISYNKDTSVYAWSAKNKADNNVLASGSFAAERITNELKSCNDCALTFYRNNTNITVSNTVLSYIGSQAEPEVGNMTDWTAAEGWSYDAAAGTLTQNTVNGSWCTWNQLFNGADGFTFSTKISFTSEIAAPNNWGDVTAGYIRDAGSGNYLKFSIRSYMNGESKYQLAVVLQYWDEASSTWSPEQFYWANKLFDTVPPTVDFTLTYDEETKLYSWSLKDGTQDIQSGSLTAGYLPAAFCDSTTLTVMLGSNGFGKVTYSCMNLEASESASCSLRETPFGSTAFVGDYADIWATVLCTDISEYQNRTVSAGINASAAADSVDADLIVVADGVEDYLDGKPTADFIAEVEAYLDTLKANQDADAVIVLTSLPYLAEAEDLQLLAAYNAGLRTLAEESDVLYADLYTAMGQQRGTVGTDGKTPTAVGNELIAGEVLEELMRSCTCLAVNSTSAILPIKTEPAAKTQAALDAFTAANDTTSMRAAVENEALGISLDFYRTLTNAAQAKTIEQLVAMDRAGATFTKADELVTLAAMQAAMETPKPDYTKQISTYVSVGDSITEGAQAINRATDGYAPRFAAMLNRLIDGGITFVNKGISGTRMCTVTDNGMFPAAKDTVDSYIVPSNPDLLSVAYGINDFHAGTTLAEFLTTYRAYVTEIQTKCPDTLIMLFELTAKGNNADMEALRIWNAGIKQIAEDLGCIYVGTYDDIRGVEWLLDDGLHPTNAGYRVLANAALRAFNSYVDLSGNALPPAQSPEVFGWETDEIGGTKDFSGWTARDEANLTADYASSVGNHRVWKSLLSNQDKFSVELDMTAGLNGSAYVKLLGMILELDARGGNGNQVYVKMPGSGNDWLAAEGRAVHVKIERNSGNMTVTLTGRGNGTAVVRTVSPTEENENVELGLYAGTAQYKNICYADLRCRHEHTQVCDAVAPTCIKAGYTGDTYCTDCGDKLTEGTKRAPLGHSFESGVCTVCGSLKINLKSAADTAYQDLLRNFANTESKTMRDVVFGYLPGTLTNAGYTVPNGSSLWEETIALMAIDTYLKTLNPQDQTYLDGCAYIANTIDSFLTRYSEATLVTPASAPFNHAMDDCGWNVYALLLGYRYLSEVGRTSRAEVCLDYAKKLFKNTYNTYYDDALGGGMWYNTQMVSKSAYAATLALAGYDLYEITHDEDIKTKYESIYNALENNLRRADGLYWVEETADGFEGAQNPYGISEGGSVTYLNANMAMAILNARLGHIEKAKVTCNSIAQYETTDANALLNDRDAWNNTFFLGYFVRELVNGGIADNSFCNIIIATAQNISDTARFDDGYYSAAWEGPKEPLSSGYPSSWQGERNRWGVQVYENGKYIGSTPNQLMTTATTIHVLFAANALQTPGDFGWQTGETSDAMDFAGWSATDAANLSANYDNTANSNIWKNLLANQENFSVELDLTVGMESSAYVKLLGVIIELDARGGNGNQVCVKLNGEDNGWLTAEGRAVHVKLERGAGGNITLTLTGSENETAFVRTVSPSEENENIELGLYAGTAKYANIVCISEVCTHAQTEVRNAADATCTEAGYSGDTYCPDCGDMIAEGSQIAALGHDLSCTDNGDDHTVTCSRCDYSITEAHTFVDGTCCCGAEEAALAIVSAALILNGKIDVCFNAQVPEGYTDAYMVVNGARVEDEEDFRFVYTGINPQCIGDSINATLYATKNGTQESVSVENFSVRQYCITQLADEAVTGELRTLLSDLLAYGAAAQTFTDYQTDSLVNSGSDIQSPTYSTFTALSDLSANFEGTADENTRWVSAGLTLTNSVAMTFRFYAESIENLSVNVTVNGRTQTFTEFTAVDGKEGFYEISFTGISAEEFADNVCASFCRDGAPIGNTVCYSVNTYISAKQADVNASLQALVKALYNYGAAAAAYAQ